MFFHMVLSSVIKTVGGAAFFKKNVTTVHGIFYQATSFDMGFLLGL